MTKLSTLNMECVCLGRVIIILKFFTLLTKNYAYLDIYMCSERVYFSATILNQTPIKTKYTTVFSLLTQTICHHVKHE